MTLESGFPACQQRTGVEIAMISHIQTISSSQSRTDMADLTPEHQDTTPGTTSTEPANPSRRKLTGAALGATAVFTLSSRPVWANQCSISGMMSGNLSKPQVVCEGCTPGYWKVPPHFDSWAATGFNTTDTFNAVFGVTQYVRSNGTPYTLLEVMVELNGNGDPISPNLGFHAVAALLNAAHPDVNFGYTAGELITLFQNNYLTNSAGLKDSLEMLNERECPLN
ncbi:MAG: hypothetical protein ACLGG4_07300 [Gammaproteobacteria bacterium]